jgi:hypothetical protein
LHSNDRPFIKLLNWYTGIGKTYNAAAFSIELFLNCDVIPVFIAPLQSLVSQFGDEVRKHQQGRSYADDLERAVVERSADIPDGRVMSVEEQRIAGLQPKVVVLLIGVNNLGLCNETAEQVFSGIKAVVATLRKQYLSAAFYSTRCCRRTNPPRASDADASWRSTRWFRRWPTASASCFTTPARC